MSYEALARKSGMSGSSLHRYCRGTSVPQDYGSLHRLAVACGAAPDELRTLHRLWALADAARERDAAGSGTRRRSGAAGRRRRSRADRGRRGDRHTSTGGAGTPVGGRGRGGRCRGGDCPGHARRRSPRSGRCC
ncbi:helix-turn-helix domain-containing protein [Streptomyces sp. MNU89]|nr:helix-turn-helix transcriptional regulator [Streptomyces sp. MNU89]MCC9742714.1 helix-turn-helix domain-containing protein [Streptomyces sp. MNU89]